eukprot:scaffold11602_cov123-Skeletonema_dohrnii-CCMP3373.AAC.1
MSLALQSGVTSYLGLPSSFVLHQQSTAQKLHFTPHMEESLVLRGNSSPRSVERGNHSNMSPRDVPCSTERGNELPRIT